jgi:hypothetical protein
MELHVTIEIDPEDLAVVLRTAEALENVAARIRHEGLPIDNAFFGTEPKLLVTVGRFLSEPKITQI